MLSYHIYFINFDVTSLLSLFCSISGSNQLPPDLEIRDGSLETMLEWSNPVPYLDSAPDCGWPPRGCRGWATACSAWHTCTQINIGLDHGHGTSSALTSPDKAWGGCPAWGPGRSRRTGPGRGATCSSPCSCRSSSRSCTPSPWGTRRSLQWIKVRIETGSARRVRVFISNTQKHLY